MYVLLCINIDNYCVIVRVIYLYSFTYHYWILLTSACYVLVLNRVTLPQNSHWANSSELAEIDDSTMHKQSNYRNFVSVRHKQINCKRKATPLTIFLFKNVPEKVNCSSLKYVKIITIFWSLPRLQQFHAWNELDAQNFSVIFKGIHWHKMYTTFCLQKIIKH